MNVKEHGQLIWAAKPRELEGSNKYAFFLDPKLGLMDIDFHQVTDVGWKNMHSPDDKTTARLVAAPTASMHDLVIALQELASQGGFKSVEVTVKKP